MPEKHIVGSIDPHGEHGPTVLCSCGWKYWHRRPKVVQRAAERHLARNGS